MFAFEPMAALAAVAILATLTTLLLRWAGLSRAAVAGGIVAGALAGSTIFGRVDPGRHERFFLGGVEQRQAIADLRGRHGADLAALEEVDVSEAALEEMRAAQRDEMARAVQAHEQAMQAHQGARLWLCGALALALVVAAMPRAPRRAAWGECLFAALWMILLTCAIVGLAVVFAFGGSRTTAIALALCFASLGTTVVVPRRSGEGGGETVVLVPAEARDRLIDVAFVVWFICFVAAIVAILTVERSGRAGLLGVSRGMLPAGAVLGLAIRFLPTAWRHGLRLVVLPSALITMLTVNVDWLSASMIAPLILALIVGGDARWLGLASALRWLGWPWREAWMATMPLIDVGPVQAALGGAFFLAGWLDAPLFACALLGAVVCDVAQPLRPKLLTILNTEGEDERNPAERDRE